jgi:hypothetical protein
LGECHLLGALQHGGRTIAVEDPHLDGVRQRLIARIVEYDELKAMAAYAQRIVGRDGDFDSRVRAFDGSIDDEYRHGGFLSWLDS